MEAENVEKNEAITRNMEDGLEKSDEKIDSDNCIARIGELPVEAPSLSINQENTGLLDSTQNDSSVVNSGFTKFDKVDMTSRDTGQGISNQEIPMEVEDIIEEEIDKVPANNESNKKIEDKKSKTSEEVNKNDKEKAVFANELFPDGSFDNSASKDLLVNKNKADENDIYSSESFSDLNIDKASLINSNQNNDITKKMSSNLNTKELSADSLNKSPECLDVEMETESEKKIRSEKEAENVTTNIIENTEFVQLNQEKEDSQSSFTRSENQPEAEDPFGCDNNIHTTDVEAMEVDSGKNSKTSKPINEHVDLEELKSKSKNVLCINKDKQKKENSDKETEICLEIEEEIEKRPTEILTEEETKNSSVTLSENPSDTSLQIVLESSMEKDFNNSSEKQAKSPSKKSSENLKNIASDILPGQDDELCIIPDSTKEKSAKDQTTDSSNSKSNKDEKIAQVDKKIETTKSSNDPEKLKNIQSNKNTEETILKVAALTTDSKDIVTVEKSSRQKILASDVIDIDDDGKVPEIEEIGSKEICKQCQSEKPCPVKVKIGTKNYKVCSDECKAIFISENNKATDIPSEGVNSKREKRCAHCLLIVEAKDEKNLSWETMEFCNEECLGKFQTKYGSYCRNCNGAVQAVSLGKYCVRFGYDVRQFCCSTCLEEFKKGLKVCSYCQKDISAGTEGFLAPVGDKGQFKDFCTQDCMEKYSKMNSTEPPVPEKKICSVCQEEKVMYCEVQLVRASSVPICSEPCFAAFKFVNKVDPDQCSTCKKYFQLPTKKGFVVFYEDEAHTFCNKTCLNVFIIQNRKIVPCNWCKVKKYNFDMIKKELKTGQIMMMCSLNCLTLYQVSINAVSARRINCDLCKEYSQAQYHLTMSDATIRNFCSYNCVMKFQAKYTKSPITIPSGDTGSSVSSDPVPTGIPKRAVVTASTGMQQTPRSTVSQDPCNKKTMPVISSVTSLAAMANGQQSNMQIGTSQTSMGGTLQPITLVKGTSPVTYKQQIVTRPTSPVAQGNKMTQCKPITHTKGVSVRPITCHRDTQTEVEDKMIVPLPVPIFIPFPVHMYSMPFPVPVPIPIPVPVPIFIPTTRNSAKGIFKEIKRIQEKIPSDPFEAELLMMAEMVATDKKNESDSESNDEARDDGDVNDSAAADTYSPEGADSTNTFGDDMLQMALKMATGEIDEPPVDLETALTPSTIQTSQGVIQDENIENDAPRGRSSSRGRKRGAISCKTRGSTKRIRRSISTNSNSMLSSADNQNTIQNRYEPIEKADANMALKYTFGVNAWRQWVITKNADLEKQSTPTRKLKLFKTDILQLTADELNYSLCLFVKEVRKPSGAEYAPDTIYYLCLGIQQYLFENNRIDNIFTDAYYEKFTDCLNEVAKKFSTVYNDALFVVTRVEEEHLWECKQLGAHSPHVLLNTLMYFNTKHFNLVSVDEHMQLSFSHIMKHWKRNSNAGLTPNSKGPISRNILLRFYPPQSALEANSKKKKVYEQQENEENPLRCPVKLYEFYLSKCPESVKTRNDVFYLSPERSCVPDSPVWYSTSPLDKEHLVKMLYRIKMVKEVNVAFISS